MGGGAWRERDSARGAVSQQRERIKERGRVRVPVTVRVTVTVPAGPWSCRGWASTAPSAPANSWVSAGSSRRVTRGMGTGAVPRGCCCSPPSVGTGKEG